MISATAGLMIFVLAVLVAIVCMLVMLTTSARYVRTRRERRRAERIALARPIVYALVDGDMTDAEQSALKTIDTMVLAMLPQLRGADRESLRTYLAGRGVLAKARRMLGSRRAVRRAESAELLGGAGDQDAGDGLRELLADRDPRVRICAARAIGRLGDAHSTTELLSAFRATSRPIPRGLAGMAILRMGAPAAPYLRDGLASPDEQTRALMEDFYPMFGVARRNPLRHKVRIFN